MTRPVIALLAMMVVMGPALSVSSHPASAQKARPDILTRLEGNWNGKGKMKPYVDSAPEPVSCSARYRFVERDDKMQLQLFCASANAKSQLIAYFDYGASSDGMTGSWYQKWSTAQAEENGSFSGRASAAAMTLDVMAGGKKRAEINVKLSGARSHSVSVAGYEKGKPTQSFSVTFNR